MKKRILGVLAVIFLLIMSSSPVRADMGPKPSVNITFINAPDEPYYAVLLSDKESYGPWSAGNAGSSIEEKEIAAFFENYTDPDGFYFIGNASKIKDNIYRWTYYPPERFKILVYFPQSGRVLTSEVQERFAFDSYYTCDLKDGSVVRNPHYRENLIGFGIRVVLTVVIELLIGLLFGFRSKRSCWIIVITNLITQTLLNAVMGILDYSSGLLVWVIFFPLMELIVILIESIIYGFALKEQKPGRRVFYAIIANIVTAVMGFFTGVFIG
ncbi:MAG: hypothetical protein IKF46_07150 [Erysipelotrichaceae bacterium]|nr:hypothetical protein [Erysipelotrichaceae bacterium]